MAIQVVIQVHDDGNVVYKSEEKDPDNLQLNMLISTLEQAKLKFIERISYDNAFSFDTNNEN